ncbi:alpha-ribazole phosphatase family protein [Undibacterium sp. TJN25]|uniref:alpha-ribazole phosphatase family protein n=1 Tax=Undibacterium sp. TJN25 TaxID=3413056 RepID=UPI003BEF8EAF
MRLYLIRHPRPELAAGTCYGQADLPADAGHCSEVVAALAQSLPPGARIISSPLQRCSVLAHALAQAMQSKVPVLDTRLIEMDFGNWEMRRWDDIARAEIDAWAADTVHYPPGGGESVLQMAARVMEFLRDIQRQPDAVVVVVCHAGPIRLMQAYRQGMQVAELAAQAVNSVTGPAAILYGQCVQIDVPRIG